MAVFAEVENKNGNSTTGKLGQSSSESERIGTTSCDRYHMIGAT